MTILGYLLFAFLVYRVLTLVFTWSTYHADARWAFPLLAVYSILVGYLFDRLAYHGFFLYHIAIMLGLLIRQWRKQVRLGDLMLGSLPDEDDRHLYRLSMASTRGYYWLSVLVHLSVFIIAYLYFYNR
jgi:hypothetical protein